MSDLVFSVSEFVDLVNQTLEYAYTNISIVGELSNFRVSKNRWVFFDLKDDSASVKFFGTVYNLPGPLEDGLIVRVKGNPRLHPQYGFSVNIQTIQPVGDGSIKKAASLLEAKLRLEGLFDESRKRLLPYPPESIGLIASSESAGYKDFIKIMDQRFGGVQINHVDVQVQGERSIEDIVQAIARLNQLPTSPEVLVITRGGGSAEDLAVFNTEQVVRAISGSRIPTLVAIGHEVDVSLAELAADVRASTPSNAAEVLVPDKKQMLIALKSEQKHIDQLLDSHVNDAVQYLSERTAQFKQILETVYLMAERNLSSQTSLLEALNPSLVLKRGYAVIRAGSKVIKSAKSLKAGDNITITMQDGTAKGTIS